MEFIKHVLDIVLHLDQHLRDWTQLFGGYLYLILFLVVFAETGFVVTPFLPGDSLLFAVGAVCSIEGSPLNVYAMWATLVAAAVIGDAVNYAIGYRIGPRVFYSETSRFLNKKHLVRTQRFYQRHGGKTIIIARFVPIIRTFAPFVAGVGQMGYRRFATFNVLGALGWVTSFLFLGYRFGQLEVVKKQFHLVLLAIIVLSIMPAVIEYLRERKRVEEAALEQAAAPETKSPDRAA
jgi:membrane-associated protein